MKHKLVVSLLTAIVIFAATTVAEAGIFGRLSVVWNGCNPCEPTACEPCEPIGCDPCEVVCDPCAPGPIFGKPFRPLGGALVGLKSRLFAACAPSCDPCEPVVCEPDPCDPCGTGCGVPFRPFGGFFAGLKSKLALSCAPSCDPCEPVVCDPCVPCK